MFHLLVELLDKVFDLVRVECERDDDGYENCRDTNYEDINIFSSSLLGTFS